MKASDLFVKALENEGVEYIFGIPGEENLDLLDSLRGSKIKFILTRHEQAAAFMAATYGRLTGKAGVCLATLGPGATNLVTAIAYAQLGAMPMVVITGQKPIKAGLQGKFQILDIVRMMEPLVKDSDQIVYGRQIPALVRGAFRIAEESVQVQYIWNCQRILPEKRWKMKVSFLDRRSTECSLVIVPLRKRLKLLKPPKDHYYSWVQVLIVNVFASRCQILLIRQGLCFSTPKWARVF